MKVKEYRVPASDYRHGFRKLYGWGSTKTRQNMKRKTTKEPNVKKEKRRAELEPVSLGDTMGSATGEADRAVAPEAGRGRTMRPRRHPAISLANPPFEEEKPFHTITRDFEESIQLDEERQEEDAEDATGSFRDADPSGGTGKTGVAPPKTSRKIASLWK